MKKQKFALDKGKYPSREEQFARLAAMPDEEIDTDDIPERLNWDGAIRGREAWLEHLEHFRPIKRSTTLRLDADILAWFKAHSPKYQTAINAALRSYVAQQERRKPRT